MFTLDEGDDDTEYGNSFKTFGKSSQSKTESLRQIDQESSSSDEALTPDQSDRNPLNRDFNFQDTGIIYQKASKDLDNEDNSRRPHTLQKSLKPDSSRSKPLRDDRIECMVCGRKFA